MKKGLVSLLAFFLVLAPVKANGSATITVDSKDEAIVGETIDVTLNIKDIKDTLDGIVAIGGDLKYDKEYLEYVSSKNTNKNYFIDINDRIMRIAGVDFTLENGIKKDQTIYTFTFKVLKEGKTNITFINPEVVDTDASVIESKIMDLNIKAKEKEIIKEEITEVEPVIEETSKEVVTTTIKETEPTKLVQKEEIKETEETEETLEEIETQEETKKTTIIDVIKDIFTSIIRIFK